MRPAAPRSHKLNRLFQHGHQTQLLQQSDVVIIVTGFSYTLRQKQVLITYLIVSRNHEANVIHGVLLNLIVGFYDTLTVTERIVLLWFRSILMAGDGGAEDPQEQHDRQEKSSCGRHQDHSVHGA